MDEIDWVEELGLDSVTPVDSASSNNNNSRQNDVAPVWFCEYFAREFREDTMFLTRVTLVRFSDHTSDKVKAQKTFRAHVGKPTRHDTNRMTVRVVGLEHDLELALITKSTYSYPIYTIWQTDGQFGNVFTVALARAKAEEGKSHQRQSPDMYEYLAHVDELLCALEKRPGHDDVELLELCERVRGKKARLGDTARVARKLDPKERIRVGDVVAVVEADRKLCVTCNPLSAALRWCVVANLRSTEGFCAELPQPGTLVDAVVEEEEEEDFVGVVESGVVAVRTSGGCTVTISEDGYATLHSQMIVLGKVICAVQDLALITVGFEVGLKHVPEAGIFDEEAELEARLRRKRIGDDNKDQFY